MTTRKKTEPDGERKKPGPKSKGLSETEKLVRMPELLSEAIKLMAKREGISETEWMRRAYRLRLGWREVLDEPPTVRAGRQVLLGEPDDEVTGVK